MHEIIRCNKMVKTLMQKKKWSNCPLDWYTSTVLAQLVQYLLSSLIFYKLLLAGLWLRLNLEGWQLD